MHKFEYVAELNVGFKEATPLIDEPEYEVRFVIEARNRATADRMVKALTEGCTNILEMSGICIDH